MVHPFLFLQFLRDILTPLLFPAAAKAGGEALKTAHTSVDTITYTWLVMVILIILSIPVPKPAPQEYHWPIPLKASEAQV